MMRRNDTREFYRQIDIGEWVGHRDGMIENNKRRYMEHVSRWCIASILQWDGVRPVDLSARLLARPKERSSDINISSLRRDEGLPSDLRLLASVIGPFAGEDGCGYRSGERQYGKSRVGNGRLGGATSPYQALPVMLALVFVAGLITAFKNIDRVGDALLFVGAIIGSAAGAGLLLWILFHLPLDFSLSFAARAVLPNGLGIGV